MRNINQGRKSLSISKEGFLYRGALLFNSLDANIRNEPKLERFKEMLKKWIKDKIPAKPASRFPHLPTRQHHVQAPPQPPDRPVQQPEIPDAGLNNIRNYFRPQDLTLPQHGDRLDQHGPPPLQVRDPPDGQHQENNNQRSIRDYFHPT